tara:strand:- start:74 stop:382 length:309 start_codon:yes stop_codon:yes gene_type:complete
MEKTELLTREQYREMSGEKGAKDFTKQATKKELEESYIEERVKALEFSQGFLHLVRMFPKDSELMYFVNVWKERLKISIDFDTDFFLKPIELSGLGRNRPTV